MLLVLSLLLLLVIAGLVLELLRSEKHLLDLEARGYQERDWPSISIVVAARNEEESIEKATRSLLQQEYPKYELIVVNDRSTDRTGDILGNLQQSHSDLKSIAIQELPNGWLGKCNALHQGAKAATGDWLLFTDADVSMRSDTLKVTIDYALTEKADHLTMAPRCEMPSWLLRAFVATFAFFLKLHVKPSRISNSRTTAHVGIGAFNMVRRDVYLAVGGHEPIRLRPDDDLKLGKLLKSKGYHQRFANGVGLISVPWYRSIRELTRGLEKNSFAGIDYSISKWIASNVLVLALFVLPFLLLLVTHGWSFWFSAASCALILFMGAFNAIKSGYRLDHGLFFPIGCLLFLFVFNRAILLTFWRKGIVWRNCFYGLDELKKNVV
jgi:glycosyltransferase involved in cell wall biosynthesis